MHRKKSFALSKFLTFCELVNTVNFYRETEINFHLNIIEVILLYAFDKIIEDLADKTSFKCPTKGIINTSSASKCLLFLDARTVLCVHAICHISI